MGTTAQTRSQLWFQYTVVTVRLWRGQHKQFQTLMDTECGAVA
jgi:hypothetical protein